MVSWVDKITGPAAEGYHPAARRGGPDLLSDPHEGEPVHE